MKHILQVSLLLASFSAPQAFAESSMAVRQTKTVLIEAHVGFNGAGAGLGIFLPDDSRLDLSVSNNDLLYGGRWFGYNKTQKIEYQSFVRNSFYYAIGLNRREIRDTYYSYAYTYPEETSAESRIEALHAHFAIGNEWSFRYFFIGAEWVGLSSPLSWKYSNTYPDTASELGRQSIEKDTERDAKQSAVILPNLYIGFAF